MSRKTRREQRAFPPDWRERMDRAHAAPAVRCAWGWCGHDVDPVTNRIEGGCGPVVCPCDHLPGWRSPYVAGQAKPSAPAKPIGRHGSRVRRSRRRHRLPDHLSAFGEWLPTVGEARQQGMFKEDA